MTEVPPTSALWIPIAMLIAISGCDASRSEPALQSQEPVPPAIVQRGDPEIEKLIDEIVSLGEEGAGYHSTAWAQQFIALDEEPEFAGGIIGSTKPSVHPAMRMLVQKGAAALPTLLGHLPDTRKTALTIGDKFTGRWFSNEYAPRDRHPDRRFPGLNGRMERNFERYTLTVGDLCFVAVGQIVNRSLLAVRYQPTLCVVVNSPVETPALAHATRKEWEGLTQKAHEESLRRDAMSRWPYEAMNALKRLTYYYPEAGEKIALELLGRDLYNGGPLWEFITGTLVARGNPRKWPDQIKEFERQHGAAAARSIPFGIHWIYWIADNEKQGKDTAERILKSIYSTYDPYDPGSMNAAEVDELTEVLKGVRGVKSSKIDQAAMDAFRRADGKAFPGDHNRIELDDLAMECMKRLAGGDHDEKFKRYLERRIKEIELTPKASSQRYRLDSLKEWRERLLKK